MDAKYYCYRFIAFHCHSSRKFRIRLASIAVEQRFILYFCTPIFNDLYPPIRHVARISPRGGGGGASKGPLPERSKGPFGVDIISTSLILVESV